MPIQTTNIDATGGNNGYTFSADYVVYVINSGVRVLTTTGIAVQLNYSFGLIDNFGLLAGGYGDGVAMYASSQNCTLINEASGSIAGYDAIIVNGSNDLVTNYGTITGWHDGINVFDGTGTRIQNHGEITGRSAGINDVGLNDILLNDGLISSTGTGCTFGAWTGTSTLQNLGTISGVTASVSSSSGGAIILKNLGSLIGNVNLTDTGGDTIVNKGSIQGDVQLGEGSNTFNGVRGTADGWIFGGSGVDIIRVGNDGETIGGGAGHDHLYGGTGKDAFVFTSLSSADSDRVHGFNVADDTIELASESFASLVAGETPEFSIAKSATSATDHLFYNTKTGMLFYDDDGSGANQAIEIADLGKGLKLTAGDFLVV